MNLGYSNPTRSFWPRLSSIYQRTNTSNQIPMSLAIIIKFGEQMTKARQL